MISDYSLLVNSEAKSFKTLLGGKGSLSWGSTDEGLLVIRSSSWLSHLVAQVSILAYFVGPSIVPMIEVLVVLSYLTLRLRRESRWFPATRMFSSSIKGYSKGMGHSTNLRPVDVELKEELTEDQYFSS